MPESRDRLSRQEDVIASYSRRRISSPSDRPTGRGSSIIFVLEDESGEGLEAGTPFRWRHTAMAGTPMGLAAGRGTIGTPRIGRIAPTIGRENLSPLVGSGHGRGSGRGTPLPTWYPRRPLNDITTVVRVIERRRELRRGGEGLQTEGPLLQDRIFHSPSMISPHPTFSNRKCPPTIGKVPKILLNITDKNDGESACLTPQKKLLNNIDTVEKVVREELRKLKRTPSAKKAEREKRVRTLLSMR